MSKFIKKLLSGPKQKIQLCHATKFECRHFEGGGQKLSARALERAPIIVWQIEAHWPKSRLYQTFFFSSTFRLSSYYRSSCLILCLTLEALRSLTWIYNKTSDICNFDLFTPIHQIGVSLKPVGRIVINTLLFHSTSHFWNFCRYTAIDVSFKPVGRIVIKVGGI